MMRRSRTNLKINGRQVVFSDLVEYGLLSRGEHLRLSYKRQTFTAEVTAEGLIRISDGRSYDNPSNAAMAAMAVEAVNGWAKWENLRGETLADLRLRLPGLDVDGENTSPKEAEVVAAPKPTVAASPTAAGELHRAGMTLSKIVQSDLLKPDNRLFIDYRREMRMVDVLPDGRIEDQNGRIHPGPSEYAAGFIRGVSLDDPETYFNLWEMWFIVGGTTLLDLGLQVARGADRSAHPARKSNQASAPARSAPVFGHVPGLPLGSRFRTRQELRDAGVHRPLQAGIDGNKDGAYSIVVSGGYIDDHDEGNVIVYTGHGGNDPSTKRQTKDQEWTRGNAALRLNQQLGMPVRVARGHKGDPAFSPDTGYRYDGLFTIEDSWDEIGIDGFRICRFRLVEAPHLLPQGSRQTTPEPHEPRAAQQPPTKILEPPPVPQTASAQDQQPLVAEPGHGQQWVTDLVGSERFATAKAQTARLSVDKVQAVLGLLDANGGQLSHAELARALEMPEPRVPGLIATVARAINLDGYPVIQDDGARITLDTPMAITQFGIR